MRVDNIKETNFRAKWYINNRMLLSGTGTYDKKSPIDCMFREGALVKSLNYAAVYIKHKIINRFLDAPTTVFGKALRRLCEKTVFGTRQLSDRIFTLKNRKDINNLNDNFAHMPESSPQYIEEIAKIGKSVRKKYININSEDKVLEKVAKSNQPTIFIMNHPNYQKDKFIYVILNSILNQMYTKMDKQKICPRPKIIVSRNMLKIIGNKTGNIYNKLGLVPVDASLKNTDQQFNIHSIKGVLKDYSEAKINLFFFPEGNNSAYTDKPLREKIQPGIVSFIRAILMLRNNVRVVPVGIHYTGDRHCMGNIYLSKPIIFGKNGDNLIYTTAGTRENKIHKTNFDESFNEMFDLIKDSMENGLNKAEKM